MLQVLRCWELERDNGKFERTMAKRLFKHDGVDLSASWKVLLNSVVFL
jgi:hypothetical protein